MTRTRKQANPEDEDRVVRRHIAGALYYVGPASELRDATNEELASALAYMQGAGHVSREVVAERIRWRTEGAEKVPTPKISLEFLLRGAYAELFSDFARRRGVTLYYDREGTNPEVQKYDPIDVDKRRALVQAIASDTVPPMGETVNRPTIL